MATRITWNCQTCGKEGKRSYFVMRLGIQCPDCGSLNVEPRDSENPHALLDEIVSEYGVHMIVRYLEEVGA